jgi:hypothetical protein
MSNSLMPFGVLLHHRKKNNIFYFFRKFVSFFFPVGVIYINIIYLTNQFFFFKSSLLKIDLLIYFYIFKLKILTESIKVLKTLKY